MRTMLILVLLWSLAQFAIAQNSKYNTEGCGTIYSCFVPESCTMAIPLAASEIMIIKSTNPVFEDCIAIIKFHAYADYWMQVSIESHVDTITSVVFAQKSKQPSTDLAVFSCELNGNGGLKASYVGPKMTFEADYEMKRNIACNFEVKLPSKKDEIFKLKDVETLFTFMDSKDGTKQTMRDRTPNMDIRQCDPSYFKFKEETEDPIRYQKQYRKVQYKPDAYTCEDPNISTMEYRGSGDANYKPIIRVECYDKKFHLSLKDGGLPVEITTDTEIDIRCVADVKYFCDAKDVKETGDPNILLRTFANKETAVASELKCPADHPHLHVKGKPVFDEGIRCVNYGGDSRFWAVGDQTLTATAPEIFCSKTINCISLHKIPESAVDGGSVDGDYIPFCHANGILQDVNGAKIDGKVTCDFATGNYTYTIGSQTKIVEKDTKFVCFYPEVKNEERDRQNQNFVTMGSILAAAFAGILVFGILAGLTFYTRRKIRIRNAKSAEMDKKLFDAFALSKDEKAALPRAPGEESTHVKTNVGKNTTWNDMLWSVRYEAACSFTLGRAEGQYESPEEFSNVEMPPMITKEYKVKHTPLKRNMKKLEVLPTRNRIRIVLNGNHGGKKFSTKNGNSQTSQKSQKSENRQKEQKK